jgi:deoxyhypusine synthase
MREVSEFMEKCFKHFNARETLASARAYSDLINDGGKMVFTMAGAMSTAEIGILLAQMIREDKVHAISSTAANLEEDLFLLVAKNEYLQLPNYTSLSAEDEVKLRDSGYNRVTDVCIPEEVMKKIEGGLMKIWQEADRAGESFFPYEYIFKLIRSGFFEDKLQSPLVDSWVVAACEKNIPIFTPAWEDSTLGNLFTASVIKGIISSHQPIKHGTAQFQSLIDWYLKNEKESSIGFFQIGGGTAGDFALCTVPCIIQDLGIKCKYWSYYSQISDSTTSYGSYSGCTPNEKITWHKLEPSTPRFFINSDATIVAPLIFSYVLGQ